MKNGNISQLTLNSLIAVVVAFLLFMLAKEVKWLPFYEHRPDKWHLFVLLVATLALLLILSVINLIITYRNKQLLDLLLPFACAGIPLFLLLGNINDETIIGATILLFSFFVMEGCLIFKRLGIRKHKV
ncbi:hypothetical protein [Pontibacter ruber]|uniref:Integral membrane protein n=1 Tax=Pontibacter ruber TaxID=1343895 RepID=A0ABW5D406_9BACT|nr:hypothetical protein [Pontibacter ruber]